MFLHKLKDVRLFIFDIDGVLTDGSVHVTESGEQLRSFNVRDGYALKSAIAHGYKVAIISGGTSESVIFRMKYLGINEIHLGVDDKKQTLRYIMEKLGFTGKQILYVGDDLPDIPVMKNVGLAVCPADAVEEVKTIAHYICSKKGGEGCVREIIEKVMKVQGTWPDFINELLPDTVTSA